MNILVLNYGGKVCNFRPDTTLEKFSRDYYIPDGMDRVAFAPVAFAEIVRTGKAVSEKFAPRYLGKRSFGLLIYDGTALDRSDMFSYAEASCLDKTSVLSWPLPEKVENLVLFSGGKEVFRFDGDASSILEDAAAKASARTFFRTGDVICAELSPIGTLCMREDSGITISGESGNERIFEFSIL